MARSVRWAFNWLQWEPSEAEFTKAISLVQLEEKERIGRFVFKKDARASLAGRLMLRKFINEYGDIPYDCIKLSRDRNGRPFIDGNINLQFNVSHQGSYTVLAGEVGNVLLGIDVMKLEYTGGKELKDFFRIMNRNFSPSEWNAIKSGTDTEQTVKFCRHWCLKESYVKAIGVGITVDLAKISFKIKSELVGGRVVSDTELFIDEVKQDWLFEESLLDSEHCVAVALQDNNSAPKSQSVGFEYISFDKLVENSVPMYPADHEYCQKYFAKRERP